MKINFYIVFIMLISFIGNSQICVSSDDDGKERKVEPEVFKSFKESTTIFVLSNIFSKEQYDEVLKKSWIVTPYKIVSYKDFDTKNYVKGNFSFALLNSYTIDKKNIYYLHSTIQFYMYDFKKINDEISKIKTTKEWKRENKIDEIFSKNIINVAHFELFNNTDLLNYVDKQYKLKMWLIKTDMAKSQFSRKITNFDTMEINNNSSDFEKSMLDFIYEKKTFKNYNLGMLKNYFQIINDGILKEKTFGMFETEELPEVKKLKSKTLYIPDYNKIGYKPIKWKDEIRSEKDLKELFKDYKYKYEFISESNLDSKILANEEIYYLRYVRVNSQKFFHVVNSNTGEVIYKFYEAGLGTYNIDDKDFKNLAKAIDK